MGPPEGLGSLLFRAPRHKGHRKPWRSQRDGEYLSVYRAAAGRQRRRHGHHIKSLSLANRKFANVVVLSFDKLVAQLDCSTPEDGTKVVLEELPKVEGVVQTNVIAVVKPVH